MGVFDGHGPEEGTVCFHSHNTRSIVGIGSADQCSKTNPMICCKKIRKQKFGESQAPSRGEWLCQELPKSN